MKDWKSLLIWKEGTGALGSFKMKLDQFMKATVGHSLYSTLNSHKLDSQAPWPLPAQACKQQRSISSSLSSLFVDWAESTWAFWKSRPTMEALCRCYHSLEQSALRKIPLSLSPSQLFWDACEHHRGKWERSYVMSQQKAWKIHPELLINKFCFPQVKDIFIRSLILHHGADIQHICSFPEFHPYFRLDFDHKASVMFFF